MPGFMGRSRRPSPAEGMTSRAIDAIREYSPNIRDFADLKTLVAAHAPEYLEYLAQIEGEGFADPMVAVDLLAIKDSENNLTVRRALLERLVRKEAIVVLPLPPHLRDSALATADSSAVFSTDMENLHAPIANYYRDLNRVPMAELEALVKTKTTVVLEGFISQQGILVREAAVDLIFMMSSMELKDIFLHAIPHMPPRALVATLQTRGADVTIWRV